jgi:hypothetical protein
MRDANKPTQIRRADELVGWQERIGDDENSRTVRYQPLNAMRGRKLVDEQFSLVS